MSLSRNIRREVIRTGFALCLTFASGGAVWAEPSETPFLQKAVASGKLPGVESRLPNEPAVAASCGC
jgi:hypothetical protein